MACRELVAALDAITSLVAAHEVPPGQYHPFDKSEVERLNELDARTYALAEHAGLPIPAVSMGRRRDCQPYGNTQVPSFCTSSGRYFIALDGWRQAMAGLRARAELAGGSVELVTTDTSDHALESMAKRRAKAKSDAAERGWQNMQLRDRLEVAWDRIYVFSPMVGEAEDYPRWIENLMHFAAVARETGFADAFSAARIADQNGWNALSLIQAALSIGREAVRARLLELDAEGDDRGWKEVFRHSTVFWGVIQPGPIAVEEAQPSPSLSADGQTTADRQDTSRRIDSTPTLPLPPLSQIEAAIRDVPDLLVDSGPDCRGNFESSAEDLAKALKGKGHNLAAAQWAIHRLIDEGKLSTDVREIALPNIFFPNGSTAFPEMGVYPVPGSGPTPFDAFVVRATDALWVWWREVRDEEQGARLLGESARVETREPEGQGPATAPSRRGRPKADFEQIQREAALAADWAQARDAGTAKVDFARDRGMKLKELEALLERVGARKRRSNK